MAWNEPGNNDNDPWNPDKNRNNGAGRPDGDREKDANNDPWGRKPGGKEQGPPDLDEAFRKLMDMLGVKKSRKSGGSNNGGDSGMSGKFGGGLIAVVLLAVLGLWGATGVYQVDQQERGVVLRLGEYHSTVMPGLHWNPSMIDSVTTCMGSLCVCFRIAKAKTLDPSLSTVFSGDLGLNVGLLT